MPKFLIQLAHDSDPWACTRVIETFLQTGSHYLKQADWGCLDGEHTAWMLLDADNKEEARGIVPPPYRAAARIVQLNKFTPEEAARLVSLHKPKE